MEPPSPRVLKRGLSKKLNGLVKKTKLRETLGSVTTNNESLWTQRSENLTEVDDLEENALDRLIIEKLHQQAGIAVTKQSTELLKPYTREQKISIYAEIAETNYKGAYEEPSSYIKALSQPHSLQISTLQNLTLQLKFGTQAYIAEFEELFGIQKIVEALRWCEYKCSSLWYYQRKFEQKQKTVVTDGEHNSSFPGIKMNTIPNKLDTEGEFRAIVAILCHLVRAIIAVLHHPLVNSLQVFVSIPDGIPICVRILEWCPLSLQGDMFLLIAGGIALQRKHQTKLFESLKRVPLYHQPFFHSVIYPELCRGTDVHYKLAYLTFVNTLISFQEIPEDRPLICRKYIPSTLLESLRDFAVVYPDDAFCLQLELIQQEMEGFEEFSEYQLSSSASSTPRGGSSITPRGTAITPRNREIASLQKPKTISINESTSTDLDHQSIAEAQLESRETLQTESKVTICEPPTSETKVPKLSLRSLSKKNIDDHFVSKEDGFDEIIQAIPAPPPMAPPPLKTTQSRYIPFKITPLPEIQQKSSIFAGFQLEHAQSILCKEDILKYFLRSDVPKSKRVKQVKEEEPEDWKSVLTQERTDQGLFNVKVILRGFATQEESVSTTEIFHLLSSCVPEDISMDTLGKLISIFPYDRQTKKQKFIHEESAYRALTHAQVSELNQAQRFLYDLYLLGNPLARLFTLQAQLTLVDYIPAISANLQIVMGCIKSISYNQELHKFLQAVVVTSNYLSERPIPATSMDLSALARLKHIKTADRSKTLLHVLLESIQRNHPYILRFPEQFMLLEEANRIFPTIIEYSATCRKELATLKENIELLHLEETLQRIYQRFQREYNVLHEKLEGIYKDMEFLGYTQARSAPCEFFPFWIDFLSTFNLSLKWIEDNKFLRVQRKRRDAQRIRDSIIHSIVVGPNENPFSDLETPSFRAGIFNLVDSQEVHLKLRNTPASKKIRRRKNKRNKRAYQAYTKLENIPSP